MTVVINSSMSLAEIEAAKEKILKAAARSKAKKKGGLRQYFGRFEGRFPDAMEIQKQMRDEWS